MRLTAAAVAASLSLWAFLALVPGAVPSARAGEPGAAPSPVAPVLAVDARMRKNVDFWLGIYTRYYTHQGLVHDAKYIDKVYEVVDPRRVRAAKRKWREVLLSLHRKRRDPGSPLTEDERKVAALYADVADPGKYLAAANRGRMRFQLGQKDRFIEGLRASGRYLPRMEAIFRREGLPVELTRLPFVESSFNLKARSKAGASGIWQFMRSTGRLYLKINDAVDERNDPIRATEAAARLLKGNYQSLGDWGLAVTAYNHGRQGMLRAVRKVGADGLEDVVGSYRSRSFGFASSNFFTELLAAIEAERHADRYFGQVPRTIERETIEVALPGKARLPELTRYLKLDPNALRELNPALSGKVFAGRLPIPAGYRLRLPSDPTLGREAQARIFLAGYEQITKRVNYVTQRRKSKRM